MKLIGPILAFALVAVAPAQKLALSVNANDGDVISGEKHFVIKVQSKNPVTQVEFYVGSRLRDQDPSTPYEFTFDTISEDDGNVQIKFTAYTSEGENVSKTLDLKIDNGISQGAGPHLSKAKDLLSVSKWDDAIAQARIALKADKTSVEARCDLARAYMGKQVWDKAQQYAEDAQTADPNNVEAMELVAAVNLNRSFALVNRTDDPMASVTAISDALKNAVTARRKSLDRQIDTFGAVTDANRLNYVDLVLRGGRYSLAIEQMSPLFKKDPKNNAVANRLIFAYMRAGRLADAREALDNLKLYGSADAYGGALEAVYESQMGNAQKADDAIRDAILNDPDNLGVKSAQAFIALRRNKPTVLAQLAKDLASTDSQRTEVNYFIAALDNRLGDPDAEKYFRRSVLIEPTNYDMYVEWGNYSLGLGVSKRLDQKHSDAEVAYAAGLYNAALIANPSSAQALTGLTLVSLYQNKIDDAVRYGRAASQAAPEYAAAHYAYAAAANAKSSSIKTLGAGANQEALVKLQDDMTAIAKKENDLAGKLDPIALQGRELPKVSQAWVYFATGGRTIVMVPPGS
ncbi:MAG TPA: tetratricopeptide repeat protein [Fimbriimonadaceae bacterium]|nr:tetratricopeptide repeat protein [Fimbriimonadaceae bacterium]